MLGYEHETAAQRFRTRVTFETVVGGVPMLILVRDLALLDTDRFATRGTKFNMNFFETFATIRFRRFHKVALTAQQFITVEACEMSHVPAATFRFGAFV